MKKEILDHLPERKDDESNDDEVADDPDCDEEVDLAAPVFENGDAAPSKTVSNGEKAAENGPQD